MSEIKKIKEQYLSKLNKLLDQNKLNEIKTELFGKNGAISIKFKQLESIPEEKRKNYATELNLLKNDLKIVTMRGNIDTRITKLKKKKV